MRIFRIWGVAGVDIAGEAEEPARREEITEPDPEIFRRTVELVAQVLGLPDVQEHSAKAELRRALTHWTVQRLLAQGNPETGRPGVCEPAGSDGQAPMAMDFAGIQDWEVEPPRLPEILVRILEAINDPRCSAKHMAQVVGRDEALASRLLTIANSEFYGFPGRIESLSQTMAIIGTRQMSMLALAAAVISECKDIPGRLTDTASFWRRSVACGIGARHLAGAKFFGCTETFFVAGLMHGFGLLVMLKYFSDHAALALRRAREPGVSLAEAEKEVFGFDHAWLGGEIMRRWKIPRRIEQAVRFQFTPGASQYPMETTMVHAASVLAGCMDVVSGAAALPLPELDCVSWDQHYFKPGILSSTLAHMSSMVDATYGLCFGTAGES